MLLLCVLAWPARAGSGDDIAAAARAQVGVTTDYDPAYVRLDYPNGDVPAHTGVCADVVVRALRAIGVDLQRALHEDMRAHFDQYPIRWGLERPDRNIDHRRVPNLSTFFERRGLALPPSEDPADYHAGDIVAWELDNGLPHIGIVLARQAGDARPRVVHNIGAGAQVEDVLFVFNRTGHYRWKTD